MKVLRQLKELKKYSSKMRLAADGWSRPWKTLISTLLSARSRDEKTIEVSKELYRKYNSLNKLRKASLKDIEKIIRPINFYKNKSKNILNCSKVLVKEYDGKVPRDFDNLVKLPGVGRKTANVFLAVYGGSNIGVDTHISYCSRKLGWSKNKKPKKIEEDLKKLFPKKYWNSLNYILVGFGKTFKSKRKKDEILEKIKKL